MKTVSAGLAWGILGGVMLHAASPFTKDLPLIPLPAYRLGPTEVRYELVTPQASDAETLPQAFHPEELGEVQTLRLPVDQAAPKPKPVPVTGPKQDDILQPSSFMAQPTPGATAYFGLANGFESATSLFSPTALQDHSHLISGNADNPLGVLAGLAIYSFGVYAIYRAIQRAQGAEESAES